MQVCWSRHVDNCLYFSRVNFNGTLGDYESKNFPEDTPKALGMETEFARLLDGTLSGCEVRGSLNPPLDLDLVT